MSEHKPSTRFYALDCVRAAAILLGVFYHAVMFGMFAGGGPPARGMMMMGGPSMKVQDWMHSFRMPLFFLISGFFGRMMLEKYGTRGYLFRRWSRIGLPLLFGLFTIIPLFQWTRGGPMGGMGRPMGPPGVSGPRREGPPPSFEGMPPPPPGFEPGGRGGPPPGGFEPGGGRRPGSGGPGFGGGGPPMMFGPQPGGLGERIFGKYSGLFKLEYLWFLWYLLVLASASPFLVRVLGWALVGPGDGMVDRLARRSLRIGLAPAVLGLIGGSVLPLLPSMFGGWTLPLASGIFRSVPDFALRLEPDMGFYLVYFLAGWWLHRVRDELPDVARLWLPFLLVGLAGHVASTWLSSKYIAQRDLPNYQQIRLVGYWLYGLGSAYTAFGFLGFFQRYVDRPSKVGRYLADTAFWVYVVHEPVMTPILKWVTPYQLTWWAQGLVIAGLTTVAALLLYEILVRHTPLARLFGPGGSIGPPRAIEEGRERSAE